MSDRWRLHAFTDSTGSVFSSIPSNISGLRVAIVATQPPCADNAQGHPSSAAAATAGCSNRRMQSYLSLAITIATGQGHRNSEPCLAIAACRKNGGTRRSTSWRP